MQKFRFFPFVLCVALAILLTGECCTLAKAATQQTVTEAGQGKAVTLHRGEILAVELRANPSTGYQWAVDEASTPLLKLVGQFQSEPPANGMVGQSTTLTLRFKAIRSGQGKLALRYARSWEPQAEPARRFSLTVRVR